MSSQSITAKETEKLLNQGKALLIDVREPDEFADEHIPFALSLPLSQIQDLLKHLKDDNRPIIFQCKLGKRGQMACQAAQGLEIKGHTIFNLEGGIEAWKAHGLAVTGKKPGKFPIIRQVMIIAGFFILASSIATLGGLPEAIALSAFVGFGLMVSGLTGWCGMAKLLSFMPWNK